MRTHKKISTARFARFLSSKHFAAVDEKQKLVRNKPAAESLVQRSSFVHPRRLNITSQSKLTQLQHRTYRAPRHLHRGEKVERARFNFRAMQERPAVADRLVAAVDSEEAVTALCFQRPAT